MKIKRKFVHVLQNRLQQPACFMQIVLGPRQVGKTTGVEQLLSATDHAYQYVSADDEIAPTQHWLRQQWQQARLLLKPAILVIDEIQKIENWSQVVKGLWDQDTRLQQRMHVILLGSSSLALHQGLTESLAGRFELIQVPHWSFLESQQAFDWDLEQFLQFGGYPGPQGLLPDVERWVRYMKQSIIEPVITKDILSIQPVQKPALFRQLFELLMLHPAQAISFQKLLGQLQDKGNAATIKHYCDLLQQAFLIYPMAKYAAKPLIQRTSTPKWIPLAPGLVRAISGRALDDAQWRGRVFEAGLLAHLVLHGIEVFYWSQSAAEVDAVIKMPDKLLAVEIKSGSHRSHKGLEAFQSAYPQAETILLDHQLAKTLMLSEQPLQLLADML